MRKIKVLYVTPLRGGIGHWSRCLVEELDKRAEVTLVTFKRKREEDDKKPFTKITDSFILEVIDPLRPHYIVEYNNRDSLKKLIDLTEKIQPDVIHFIMWAGPQILWFLRDYTKAMKKREVPTILTLHEAFPQLATEEDIRRFKEAYEYADFFVVLTNDSLSDLRNAGITTPGEVISHGHYHAMNKNLVNKERARYVLSKKLKIKLDKNISLVSFFGFIREYKGLLYLIKAAPFVLQKIPDAMFLAAGSVELDENPEQYEKEIHRLGLEKQFLLFTKYVKDDILFESFFKASDVVAYPYIGVSQSGAMITAIGMKRPVIISELGSFIKELKQKGVLLTSEPRNPESIANKIIYLLENKNDARKIAERAYRIFGDEYSWKNIADEYCKIYKKLTN